MATLSDSTGARIGMVSRSSAACDERRRQARSFAAKENRDRAAAGGTPAAACPAAGTVATIAMPRLAKPLTAAARRLTDGNRQAKRAAHRAAQGLPAERIGRSVGGDDAGRAAAFSGANDGAHIAGILDAVEQHNQLGRAREHLVERCAASPCASATMPDG